MRAVRGRAVLPLPSTAPVACRNHPRALPQPPCCPARRPAVLVCAYLVFFQQVGRAAWWCSSPRARADAALILAIPPPTNRRFPPPCPPQCGFALLEAGSVRGKNVRNILLKNVVDACVAGGGWEAPLA